MNKAILMVLDGFGEGEDFDGNAVTQAKMSFIESLKEKYPSTLLKTSGNAVGLPEGAMGGSEAGHLTMGAGRIIWQPLEEINRSIESGDFFEKKDFKKACQVARENNSALHLMGLLSDGGIHSHEKHLYALLELAKKEGVEKVYIHAMGDGRDVHTQSICEYLEKLQAKIDKIGVGKIGSIIGRFYAMDRDTNWDRTEKAYKLYTSKTNEKHSNICESIKEYYKKAAPEENYDYYLPAFRTEDFEPICNEDAVIFFNFRSDRSQQLTRTFTEKDFMEFEANIKPFFVCMGPYSHIAPVVFPPKKIENNLGEILSKNNLKQLRIAETEKFAHVTFFFNSQEESPYEGEDRILVNSPKVASYSEKPEMSAHEITEKVLPEIEKENYDFILLNFANLDLVGHSGELEAAIKACQVVDECTKKIVEKAREHGYDILITGDHGNAEAMFYEGGHEHCTSHTLNPTRCIVVSDQVTEIKEGFGLSSVAPTLLELMGIDKVEEMEGESLIK